MTTEFDRKLNEWFNTVEPTQLPSSILPAVFAEVGDTGQKRKPWHRFAASMELAWARRSPLSPTLVMVILTALLLVALAAAAVAGGFIRLPERHQVLDGLVAVADELKNPDAAVPGNNRIRFIDPATGADVYTTSDTGSNCGAHFSPDGSRYALLYQETDQIGTGIVNIGVADSEAGSQPTFLFRKEAQIFFDPSWAPDGSALVTTIEDATGTGLGDSLWVLPMDGSAARQITDTPTSISASWSPSGKWIAFLGQGAENQPWSNPLYVIHPDGTGLRKLRESGIGKAVWSPTTDQLAYAGADGQLHVVNPDGVELETHRLIDPNSVAQYDAGVGDPKWSPDGTRIAFGIQSLVTYPRAVDVLVLSSGSLSSIATTSPVGIVDWSADSQKLVGVDDDGNLLELTLDGNAPRLIASRVRGFCMSAGRALSWQKVEK